MKQNLVALNCGCVMTLTIINQIYADRNRIRSIGSVQFSIIFKQFQNTNLFLFLFSLSYLKYSRSHLGKFGMKNKLYYCFWLEQKLNVKIMSGVELQFTKFNHAQTMQPLLLSLGTHTLLFSATTYFQVNYYQNNWRI